MIETQEYAPALYDEHHIRQWLQWDKTPMGARCALAMSRVLQPLDPALASELREHAQVMAFEVGLLAVDRNDVSPLLAADELLNSAFQCGYDDAQDQERWLDQHPLTVWFGDWNMDDGGECETRASVASSQEGYLPGLEVSRLGGYCEPSYDNAVPTFEQAIALAKAREANWHLINFEGL